MPDDAPAAQRVRQRRLARRARMVAICLLVGVALNVAVAWVAAVFRTPVPSGTMQTKLIDLPTEKFLAQSHDAAFIDTWTCLRLPNNYDPSYAVDREPTAHTDALYDKMNRANAKSVFVRLFGWPMHGLTWTAYSIPGPDGWMEGGVYMPGYEYSPDNMRWLNGDIRILPLTPRPLAFTLNTMFYALLFWALVFVPLAVRRRRRQREGHCLGCGYDLTGAKHERCPECAALVGSQRPVEESTEGADQGSPGQRPG